MLLSLPSIGAALATSTPKNTIKVKFVVDSQSMPCKSLGVQLTLGKQQFTPDVIGDKFVVPPQILEAYASKSSRRKANVTATVTCDSQRVTITGLYPASALSGAWTAGISYPTSWFDDPEISPEVGDWVSYLETECNDCDPGVIAWQSHSDIPQGMLSGLRKEQPTAEGPRAMDIAFALAVFQYDYQANRGLLLKRLDECLADKPDSDDDDSCDKRLFNELVNLYWRGDASLLQPLLEVADHEGGATDNAGSFYATLLDQRTAIALEAIEKLPDEKQRSVCARSVEDDLRFDPPKLDRVARNLRISSHVATACLKTVQDTAALKH
jgi:hypothetical protein